MATEKEFDKYKKRGSLHWREMTSRDPRVFNAFQQGRYEWIRKLLGNVQGKRVLDVGCGDGSLTYLLAAQGAHMVGADNEPLGITFAKENVASKKEKLVCEFVVAGAYDLPFDDNSFDAIVSCEVIEHLQEPERMLREAARVLKPGGVFILTTPYRTSEHPSDPNHVREYYPGEIEALMQQYFSEVRVKATHHMLWTSLYSYAWRSVGNRPLGRWVINVPSLLFGWNPFMIDYQKNPNRFDRFASICAWGTKQ